MYRVIKASSINTSNCRYEARWVAPNGSHLLFGASDDFFKAEELALEMLDSFAKDSQENRDTKAFLIQNCYIYDTVDNEDVTSDLVLDKGDVYLKQIELGNL